VKLFEALIVSLIIIFGLMSFLELFVWNDKLASALSLVCAFCASISYASYITAKIDILRLIMELELREEKNERSKR